MSKYLDLFKEEALEILQTFNDALLALEENSTEQQVIEELFRAAHSLKGMAATMGFDDMAGLTHKMESLMDKIRKDEIEATTPLINVLFKSSDVLQVMIDRVGDENLESKVDLDPIIKSLEEAATGGFSSSEDIQKKKQVDRQNEIPSQDAESKKPSIRTVRVKLEHLDNLMNLVGELVISKARLDQIEDGHKFPELSEILDRIKAILGDLQHEVMQVRMVPVGQVFNRYPRMVRDIAHELGKEVDFAVEGSDIELDRTILDEIGDPLVHLLRNAVGHGIEMPDEREQSGKPRVGTIRLIAKREKDGAIIEVSDDGRGIDSAQIRNIAVEKGFITQQEAESLDESEATQLICLPGFTSTCKTTSLSGRGVGVDAVKAKIALLGGTLCVKSQLGEGTRFIMNLPPSLAIIKALLIDIKDDTYAISLKDVAEVVEVGRSDIKTVKDEDVIIIRDEVVPLIFLRQFFDSSSDDEDIKDVFPVVVVEVEDKKKGLVVDAIKSQQDVVIKPLNEMLKSVEGLGGATILGNGKVAFILDVRNLSLASGRRRIYEETEVD